MGMPLKITLDSKYGKRRREEHTTHTYAAGRENVEYPFAHITDVRAVVERKEAIASRVYFS